MIMITGLRYMVFLHDFVNGDCVICIAISALWLWAGNEMLHEAQIISNDK